MWGGDLLACEPREFPDAFGYGLLEEERSGWCVPLICTNTAVEESGNATCRRKPVFRPVDTDSYRSKFCWFCCLWEPLVHSSMPFPPPSTLDIAWGCGSHLVLRAMSASRKRCSHSHFHIETFLPLLLVPVITSLLQCQQSSIRHHY